MRSSYYLARLLAIYPLVRRSLARLSINPRTLLTDILRVGMLYLRDTTVTMPLGRLGRCLGSPGSLEMPGLLHEMHPAQGVLECCGAP